MQTSSLSRSVERSAQRLGWPVWSVLVTIVLLLPGSALAWDTGNCSSSGRTSDGACTVVSNDVATSGAFGPVGRDTTFTSSENIGVWQSINNPPGGYTRWRFDYDYQSSAVSAWQTDFDSNVTQMTIGGSPAWWTVWDDKFLSHPPGRYRAQVFFDAAGGSSTYEAVAGGVVEFSVCGGDFEQRCVGGDVYWYDACGSQRSRAQDCSGGALCVQSGATASCECDPGDRLGCSSGDVYEFDSCGGRGDRVETCSADEVCMSAGDAAWCECAGTPGEVCYRGDVWVTDTCGDRSSLLETCATNETCVELGETASCECSGSPGEVCYRGDVWATDSCGERTSQLATCGTNEACIASGDTASCECTGSAGEACYRGDVWAIDGCGNRTSELESCGANEVCVEAGDLATCECAGEPSTTCHAGDVYAVDACGTRGERLDTCGAGESCSVGPGGASCACEPDATLACDSGDIYAVDSCGERGALVERCSAPEVCGLVDGVPTCACTGTPTTRCSGGNIFAVDACGGLGERVQECEPGATCTDSLDGASCGCTPGASIGCADGDVYAFDSCGNRGTLVDACEGAEVCVSAGGTALCECSGEVTTVCDGNDVYHVDACGVRGDALVSCERGCVAGACVPEDGGPGEPGRPFDPNCLISDDTFRNIASMSQAEVQAFLDGQRGRLNETDLWRSFDFAYAETSAYFYGYQLNDGTLARQASPAELIWQSSRDNGDPAPTRISPAVLLVMLQKEQSLISQSSRAEQRILDWAMGFAVPDSGGRNESYRGFAAQVLSAAYQLSIDFERGAAEVGRPQESDGGFVYPENAATWALYQYTPHRESAENFYRLYWQYFGDPGTCGDGGGGEAPALPTASGLPTREAVNIDGNLPLYGSVETGEGDRFVRVTVAVSGPGIIDSDRRLSMPTTGTRFNLATFAFSPSEFGVSDGAYTFGVWADTDYYAPRLLGQFVVTVRPNLGDGPAFLRFPLTNRTAETVGINSVFDHSMSTAYRADGRVVAFTGEEGRLECGADPAFTTGLTVWRAGECRPDEALELRGQNRWAGLFDERYVYYEGHPGLDFKSAWGEAVIAPAAGVATVTSYGLNCPDVRIDHGNGYSTRYLHMHDVYVSSGDTVDVGEAIGTVGARCTSGAHLHFEVLAHDDSARGYHRVDPYGWQGAGADPYSVSPDSPELWLTGPSGIGGEMPTISCLQPCDAGETCYEGSCIPSCGTEFDCLVGEACLEGACVQVCYPTLPQDCEPGVPFNPGEEDYEGPLEVIPPEDMVEEPGEDVGPDAGPDAGSDAGPDVDEDVAPDAGPDAEPDSNAPDVGDATVEDVGEPDVSGASDASAVPVDSPSASDANSGCAAAGSAGVGLWWWLLFGAIGRRVRFRRNIRATE